MLLGNRMKVQSSSVAKRTTNPIRNIVDASKVIPNPDLEVLSLSLGDPTVFGNLKTAVEVTEAVKKAVDSHKADGYVPVIGSQAACEAICQRYKSRFGVSYAADVRKLEQKFNLFLGYCNYFGMFRCVRFGHFCTL